MPQKRINGAAPPHSTFFDVKLWERRPVKKAAYNQGFGRGGKTTA